MRKIWKLIFPEKSKWIDVGVFDQDHNQTLVQMRFRLDNNKKEFRRVKIMGTNHGSNETSQLKEEIIKNKAECT